MEVKELYWLAGLVEGEGTFQCDRRSNSFLRFAMCLTEKLILVHAKKLTNIGTISGPYWNKKSTKPYWMWRVDKDSDAAALMMTLYPLLWDNRQERIKELLKEWRALPKVRRRV